ncbi:MAG: DUF3341 domain-containing protein [Myxococcota bacterium]
MADDHENDEQTAVDEAAEAATDAAEEAATEAAEAAEEAVTEAAEAAEEAVTEAAEAAEEAVAAAEGAPEEHDDDDDDDDIEKRPALYLAEYETPDALMAAAIKCRDEGFSKWDCHTPYPVHGLDEAMGLKPTQIGWISMGGAMTGLITAVLMIQFMNNWDYPIVVGGKPPGAFPSMVPIMFELTVLLTGFGTLFGMFGLTQLPRHHHPVFYSDRFDAASDDKFFISIEVADEKFDVDKTRAFLEATDTSFIELIEEEV